MHKPNLWIWLKVCLLVLLVHTTGARVARNRPHLPRARRRVEALRGLSRHALFAGLGQDRSDFFGPSGAAPAPHAFRPNPYGVHGYMLWFLMFPP